MTIVAQAGATMRVVLVMFLMSTSAAGQERVVSADDSGEASARELFNASREAYDRGEFGHAVELLQEAYRLSPRLVIFYNLARAYEADGALEEAANSYERYLAEAPEIEDRPGIEGRIATLREQIAARDTPAAVVIEARSPTPIPWILAGVGAAALAAGIVFGILSQDEESAAQAEPIHVDRLQRSEDAETLSTTANILFIAGGAVTLIGTIWGLVDVLTLGGAANLSVNASPTSLALSVTHR